MEVHFDFATALVIAIGYAKTLHARLTGDNRRGSLGLASGGDPAMRMP